MPGQRIGSFAGLALSVLVSATAHAQTLGPGSGSELGLQALEMGREAIDDVPEQLSEFLEQAAKGEEYGTEKECLGALQVAMNVATIAANLLPFSEAWELEDERGQVGRVRMVINGDKIHMDAYCRGSTLVGEPLPWGVSAREPQIVAQTTLDALLGGLLLLELQGAFDDTEDVASTVEERDPVASAVEDAVRSTVGDAENWQEVVIGELLHCYNTDFDAAVTIDAEVQFDTNGRPQSIDLIAFTGDAQIAQDVFGDLRRAVLRCSNTPYPVPGKGTTAEVVLRMRAIGRDITPIE